MRNPHWGWINCSHKLIISPPPWPRILQSHPCPTGITHAVGKSYKILRGLLGCLMKRWEARQQAMEGANGQSWGQSQEQEKGTLGQPVRRPQRPEDRRSPRSAGGALRPLPAARGARRGLAGSPEHGGAARGPRLAAGGPRRSGAQCGGAALAVGGRPPAPRPGTAAPLAGQVVGAGPRGPRGGLGQWIPPAPGGAEGGGLRRPQR